MGRRHDGRSEGHSLTPIYHPSINSTLLRSTSLNIDALGENVTQALVLLRTLVGGSPGIQADAIEFIMSKVDITNLMIAPLEALREAVRAEKFHQNQLPSKRIEAFL